MSRFHLAGWLLALGLLTIQFTGLPFASAEEEEAAKPKQPDMREVMKRISPGPEHEMMTQFVGEWDVAMSFSMPGQAAGEPSKGKATFEWLYEGRWMSQKVEIGKGWMGQPYRTFSIHGYDNMCKNWVTMAVNSMDTSMNVLRGVKVDPKNKVFVEYGTINEWLDGTFNKPIKAVTKLIDENTFEFDIWDLQIGEHGHPVVKFVYTRANTGDDE